MHSANLFFSKISKTLESWKCLFFFLIFNCLFTTLSVFFQSITLGVLFLIVNVAFLILSSTKNGLYIIFSLFPVARVLKFPGIETSLFTILLFCFLIILVAKQIIKRRKISFEGAFVFSIFLIYICFTFCVSLLNKNDSFRFLSLASYYLYLSFPVLLFGFINNKEEIDGTSNIIFCIGGYLYGMVVTLLIYNLVPNGIEILEKAGVIIFEMGSAGVRISPLTDDPNYGTALILISSLFFLLSRKTRWQTIVGYPLMILAMLLSITSLSKMFILGALAILLTLTIKLMLSVENLFVGSTIIVSFVAALFLFMSSNSGMALFIRFFGTQDGIDLNRITSGRTDLFGIYSSYILGNPLVTLFGKGPLFADVSYFTAGEHNSFTKLIFSNGLVGSTLLTAIFVVQSKHRFSPAKNIKRNMWLAPFLFCLFICSMSLGMPNSTSFPILLALWQYLIFSKQKIEVRMEQIDV